MQEELTLGTYQYIYIDIHIKITLKPGVGKWATAPSHSIDKYGRQPHFRELMQ